MRTAHARRDLLRHGDRRGPAGQHAAAAHPVGEAAPRGVSAARRAGYDRAYVRPIAYRAPDDWDAGPHWIRKPQYWALMLMPSVLLMIFLLLYVTYGRVVDAIVDALQSP